MTTARKQPQDRKPKATESKAKAVETTAPFRISTAYELRETEGWQVEVDGVEVFLPKAALRDDRAARIMGKAQAGDEKAIAQYRLVTERMLGEEQYDRIQDAFEDPETGWVDTERVTNFVAEVIKAANPNG